MVEDVRIKCHLYINLIISLKINAFYLMIWMESKLMYVNEGKG
jgi:hypothetical protein